MLANSLLPVLALVASALAAGPISFTKTVSTRTELLCSTQYGTKSIAPPLQTSVSTKTKTLFPWFGTSVSTPIVTVTPAPVTQTSVVEETTVATITDTTVTDVFSTTLTEITTQTDVVQTTSIVTSTALFTATETAPESNSIVPTSTGFLPIESTVNGYPNTPSKRFSQPRGESSKHNPIKDLCKDRFPQQVTCTNWVFEIPTIIYVKTAKPSTSTLPPATTTAFSTVVVTSTSTVVPPNVSTTSSFTTTSTAVVTSTNTEVSTFATSSTTTLTLTHTTSVYAACTPGAKNLMGPKTSTNSGWIMGISDTNSFYITRPGNEYNCCVECQNNPKCAGSIYKIGPGPASEVGQCLHIQNHACNNPAGVANQAQFTRRYYDTAYDNTWGSVWSNGNCGYLQYGGRF